jgi:hypothetical protein
VLAGLAKRRETSLVDCPRLLNVINQYVDQTGATAMSVNCLLCRTSPIKTFFERFIVRCRISGTRLARTATRPYNAARRLQKMRPRRRDSIVPLQIPNRNPNPDEAISQVLVLFQNTINVSSIFLR